ncbi:MAG TPA: hypothetical protein VFB08_18305 [Burkholderiales bacterium]|nr:hypothetical protein [Burkholderiales bacterium]
MLVEALILLLGASSPAARASTYAPAEMVCPLDGKPFRQTMAMSGTQVGQMLDLKPVGALQAPWPLPVCPGNSFVVYREFRPREIERLKRFVKTPQYAALRRKETAYYRVARTRRFLGESDDAVAFSLLQATWEARSPSEYARYARETLGAYRRILARARGDEETWRAQQLLVGELQRRLGLFEDARGHFMELAEGERFSEGVWREIVALQLRLVEERSIEPHEMPREGTQ